MGIKRIIRDWLADSDEKRVPPAMPAHDFNRTNGMQLSVFPASGGYIVEYRKYNEKTDRYDSGLHIIHQENKLAESVAKIMTAELLKGV